MDKFLKQIVWVIILIPAVYLAIVWKNLPETVAVHFDLRGQADRLGSKNELIKTSIILIIANAIVYLILTNIYRIDPKRYAAENKSRLQRIGFAVCVFMSAVLCFIIYNASHGNINFSTRLMLAGMGLLFALIGNYMHTIKPNYFAGFRLPWTLESEDNWRQTHLLGGKLWFIGGIAIAVVCLILPPTASLVAFYTIMIVVVIIPAVYSYRLYKKQNSRPE
jgi:immunity protein, SdpI family